MASVKEIQDRIHSIQDTRKMTNAMYLISSSKLKKAKKAHDNTAPYFSLLESTISAIIEHTPSLEHIFFDRREKKAKRNEGYLVITGDKGLCGAYNHNVIKLAEKRVLNDESHSLFVVGEVGRRYFEKKGYHVENEFLYTAQNPNIHRAGTISEVLIDLFVEGYLDDVYLVYTRSISPMVSNPEIMKILPLEKHRFEDAQQDKYSQTTVFSPSVDEVMDHLVPNYVRGLVFSALIESFSSEQNSRMMAMDAATKSADDVLSELSLAYNRARQAAITQEMNEIVGGSQSFDT
ncbi:MAG TPA: ATP synthase F1 subunit gamma [Candidatus Anaerotignum merdipullorum]|nr:ATP synthase F1 subunit gamma [Candidatus Anaerotignum merdipullorum]